MHDGFLRFIRGWIKCWPCNPRLSEIGKGHQVSKIDDPLGHQHFRSMDLHNHLEDRWTFGRAIICPNLMILLVIPNFCLISTPVYGQAEVKVMSNITLHHCHRWCQWAKRLMCTAYPWLVFILLPRHLIHIWVVFMIFQGISYISQSVIHI